MTEPRVRPPRNLANVFDGESEYCFWIDCMGCIDVVDSSSTSTSDDVVDDDDDDPSVDDEDDESDSVDDDELDDNDDSLFIFLMIPIGR
jgi:hypothetical protein